MRAEAPSRCESGFALVIVLIVLLLVFGMVVAILSRTGVEVVSADSYATTVDARQLGSSTINLVQGQIDHAVTRGSNIVWASQPGMIRTFDDKGDLALAYKLYSAAQLTTDTISLTEDIPPATWTTDAPHWTDLNAPSVSDSRTTYPIFDPGVANDPSQAKGLTVTALPGTASLAAMPVRWLYVAKDGQIVAPTNSTGTSANFDSSLITSDNPIVGRIAFWTDDETSKINVNTASAGTFWATPKYSTAFDRSDLANFQAVQNEFSRYPGHPGAVSLLAAFPSHTAQQILESGLAPRYGWGGSKGGTTAATDKMKVETRRLYASVDEMIFDKSRANSIVTPSEVDQRRFLLTASSRAPEVNLFNLPRVPVWPIHLNDDKNHRSSFDDLIARAATINGHPYYFQREDPGSVSNDIAIPRNAALYSYLQNLSARPISIGGAKSFATKYKDDSDQILTEIFDYVRSTNLVDDLLASTSGGQPFTAGQLPVADNNSPMIGHGSVTPSHGPNDTMGFGRFYTISELGFLFICNADAGPNDGSSTEFGVEDSNVPPGAPVTSANVAGNVDPPSSYANMQGRANKMLVPNQALKAYERRIQAMVLIELFSPSHGFVAMRPALWVRIKGLDQLQVENISLEFPATEEILIKTLPSATNIRTASDPQYSPGFHLGRVWGGNPGFRFPLTNRFDPPRGPFPGTSASYSPTQKYPFISVPITIKVPAGGSTMNLTGGNLTIEIYTGEAAPSPASLVQTIAVTVPSDAIPVPDLVDSGTAPAPANVRSGTFGTTKEFWWGLSKHAVVGIDDFGTAQSASAVINMGRLYGLYPGKRNLPTTMLTSAPGWEPISGALIRTNQGDANSGGRTFDVLQTLIPYHGDYRLVASQASVPASVFKPHPFWGQRRIASNLYDYRPDYWAPGYDQGGKYAKDATYSSGNIPDIPSNFTPPSETTGDWDAGLPYALDGPYINKPDEESNTRVNGGLPYFVTDGTDISFTAPAGDRFFSPNRIIPSPAMLGSLPTGVKAGDPWQTLLFRHQPGHPGEAAPADHYYLDLFWMPVVEPYAISEPFSTAGKINLNYQIMPFTNIKRATAILALTEAEYVEAVPSTAAQLYKKITNSPQAGNPYRSKISEATLEGFQTRFDQGQIFRSASEICDLWIVPEGQSQSSMVTFWKDHALTGENVRERLYGSLYQRVTTKSNTYTIHYKVQSLKKSPSTPPNVWQENRDSVAGEYRGSTTIERYINPDDPGIPNYAESPNSTDTLDSFYKWRVISNNQFAN